MAPLVEVGGDVMQQGRVGARCKPVRREDHQALPGQVANRDQGHEPAQSRDPQWRFLQHYQRQYVSATIGRGNGQNGFQVGCGVNFK
jgi:hypothetical protein